MLPYVTCFMTDALRRVVKTFTHKTKVGSNSKRPRKDDDDPKDVDYDPNPNELEAESLVAGSDDEDEVMIKVLNAGFKKNSVPLEKGEIPKISRILNFFGENLLKFEKLEYFER